MMKKILVVLGTVMLLCASASPLLAGGIINKSNLSADYFRSLTRHASTDAADIVVYNPAGVMKMENGFYTKLDALYIAKDYSNTVSDSYPFPGGRGEFNSDVPSIVPGFFTVYKQDKWAALFSVTVPGGGGKVEYDEGNARTSILALSFIADPRFGGAYTGIDSMNLEADSVELGFTLGGAYEINKMFSVAAGFQYIDAEQSFKGDVDLTNLAPGVVPEGYSVDLERTAEGFGYFVGLNVAPMDNLNLGLTYKSNTKLDFKSDVSEDTSGGAITEGVGWADGTKEREDLPGLIGLGVSYMFTPKVRVELNYTRYLESSATFEGLRFDDPGDSSDVAVSCTYTFNDQWRASIGYMYTDINGMAAESLLPEAPELDAQTFALGAVYSPMERLDVTFGFTKVNYDSVTTNTTSSRAFADTEHEKDIWAISLGAQYRFF